MSSPFLRAVHLTGTIARFSTGSRTAPLLTQFAAATDGASSTTPLLTRLATPFPKRKILDASSRGSSFPLTSPPPAHSSSSSSPSSFSSSSSPSSFSSSSTPSSPPPPPPLPSTLGEPRSIPNIGTKAKLSSPCCDRETLTTWKQMTKSGASTPMVQPSATSIRDGGGSEGRQKNLNDNSDDNRASFLSAVSTQTLQGLMRSLFFVPLTEGGCALGFFTRVCMRDLATTWTDGLQEALVEISGKQTKDLTDTWACGFVTSCSLFRKAVNVTDQLPLVSALSGKTFLFDFDNVTNYNFSDPFYDVAFVQLTPPQIAGAQNFDYNFLPMNLSLHHDIYDQAVDSLMNGKDVLIAKQLQGFMTQTTREKIATHGIEEMQTMRKSSSMVMDDTMASGVAPAVNRTGELVGICRRKFNERDVLLPTKMLSASIAADLDAQIGASADPMHVYRPEWMDYKIRYTELHDLGLLAHPLAYDNEEMIDFVDWPCYEEWYQKSAPLNHLTFTLTDKHLYLRPEEEYTGV